MYLIGFDIGSSSVKAALLDRERNVCIARSFAPRTEMPIQAPETGWAEQDPALWWQYLGEAARSLLSQQSINPEDIEAIGISYQMHGLVCVDKRHNLLRPAIIWCDSRAVETGREMGRTLGENYCLEHLLNSPGNFTASKLRWVQQHEPEVFSRIHKIMLPGDYIALKLTGEITTTASGLSEGILWDFPKHQPGTHLLRSLDINPDLLPSLVPTFGEQGRLTAEAAGFLGLHPGIPVSYRAGDQPNNALSLNVLDPGEVAATAGTSGVVYGVSDQLVADPQGRVNTFAHVNHQPNQPRLGILLCINGVGILNAWLHNQLAHGLSYDQMNQKAAEVRIGSDGLVVLPFGNGAERMLGNITPGCSVCNLHFPVHCSAHLFRAAQEGIAFAFAYGLDVMQDMGVRTHRIRAGNANMFQSEVFRQTLADVTGASIELYDTDGAIGAALGAGMGSGLFASRQEAFAFLRPTGCVTPAAGNHTAVTEAYEHWKEWMHRVIPSR